MIERIRSASTFEERYGFCRAIRVGDRIEVAGTAPIPQDGGPTPADPHSQCCSVVGSHSTPSSVWAAGART
ncbi:MAG TPA: hypothetical protein VMS74_10625 [Acidimicrobiia bacterium]|nr:hypothetical protein [Acidimicrobiia bacterium]